MTCSPDPCRLLIDPPAAGAWNMAVDEVLLDGAAEQNRIACRMYRWECPTLSLGYFQSYAQRRRHPPSRECTVVRRLTGGGAIVHDVELTYSLVVPGGHPFAQRRDELYRLVHQSLVRALAVRGVPAALCAEPPRAPAAEEPFLCFLRRAPGDVLVGTVKVAGSAQRRRRGAVLQHGSVLLGRSRAAEGLEGLAELSGRPLAPLSLADGWLKDLSEHLALRWCEDSLRQSEAQKAARLVEDRYGVPGWTERRGRQI